jgi:hypothetical protein
MGEQVNYIISYPLSEEEQKEQEFIKFLNSPAIRELMEAASNSIRAKLENDLLIEFSKNFPRKKK